MTSPIQKRSLLASNLFTEITGIRSNHTHVHTHIHTRIHTHKDNYSTSYTIDNGVPQDQYFPHSLLYISYSIINNMKRYTSDTYNLYADDIKLDKMITNSTQLQECLNKLQN